MNLPNLAKNPSIESSHKQKQMLNITKQCMQYNFNYEILDTQTQISVKQKTFEIKSLIRQTAKDIISLGQKLSEVKQQLKHGEFRNWLKIEFNWSVSSATKFMQVSEQFKNVNFTHFNFAASALYILAAPSTPESARNHALQLAAEGENITYSLAKLLVKQHKELAKTNTYLPNQLNSSNITQLDTQEILSEVDVIQKNFAINPNKSVRIIAIKQESTKYIEDKIQDFEIIYAGNCIAVKGRPKKLTVLFKKMQDNPQFAEDIFKQAELLSE